MPKAALIADTTLADAPVAVSAARPTAAQLARIREARAVVAKAEAMIARSERIDAWLKRGAPLDDIPA